jgi:hypothetical protein
MRHLPVIPMMGGGQRPPTQSHLERSRAVCGAGIIPEPTSTVPTDLNGRTRPACVVVSAVQNAWQATLGSRDSQVRILSSRREIGRFRE